MLELLGIHPDFWAVIGDTNPLDEYDYCELPYFIKVWLVKGLCDYITVSVLIQFIIYQYFSI